MRLTFTLIIISISSPTLSFIPDLKPYFSANPSHLRLPFFFSGTDYMDSPYCLLLLLSISVFYVLVFPLFICWFHAVV